MRLDNLAQPPFETTLMGVVKGALDYYGFDTSPALAYGAAGHAFVINIHDQLCPSGPYCWDTAGFVRLLANLGLEMHDLGFFHAGSSPDERRGAEERVIEALDQGVPCSLCNTDHQLILGYEGAHLVTARPWPGNPHYPAATLTRESWSEFGDECHVNFFALAKGARTAMRDAVAESLAFAVEAYRGQTDDPDSRYAMGERAYANWLAALGEFGDSHGHWWNATVWSECRRMASDYLGEVGALMPAVRGELAELASEYGQIAGDLHLAAERTLPTSEKARLIGQAAEREAAAVDRMAHLPMLRAAVADPAGAT
jgi:hypothetical protein